MIEVKNLSKSFTRYEKEEGLLGLLKGFFNAKKVEVKAVENISFSIQAGEVVGYIGANGAGKSTTIKMLTGILNPSHGEVKINGIVPYMNRVENAKNIGVVFGQRTQLWWDLPLIESFRVLKEIYEVSDLDYQSRMKELNEILNLDEFIKSPVRTLSLGQRMRADIAAALIHNPKVLYLDEPTIGLDINAKKNMRQAIKDMNQRFNTTVLLTTHDLDDIEELCSRIIIIDHGKLIYDGALSDIKKRYGSKVRLNFEFKEGHDGSKLKLPKDVEVQSSHSSLSLHFDKNLYSIASLSSLVFAHAEVIDVAIFETPIEEIVGMIYQEGHV
jgi:ABC-2 type transport system ATP-binding protein